MLSRSLGQIGGVHPLGRSYLFAPDGGIKVGEFPLQGLGLAELAVTERKLNPLHERLAVLLHLGDRELTEELRFALAAGLTQPEQIGLKAA